MKFGIYLGRFSPVHLGHQVLIEKLLETYESNHLILIGSCNHSISYRHLFSYNDRKNFIATLYPNANVAPLPDSDSNQDWFAFLDDIIKLACPNSSEVTFIGGCQEDVSFFIDNNKNVSIINRFNGQTPKISATEVRDALIEKRSIEGLIDDRIIDIVQETFVNRWNALKKL